MSRLAEFRQLEQQLAAQLAELEAMKNDSSLKKEIEFEKKLRALKLRFSMNVIPAGRLRKKRENARIAKNL